MKTIIRAKNGAVLAEEADAVPSFQVEEEPRTVCLCDLDNAIISIDFPLEDVGQVVTELD